MSKTLDEILALRRSTREFADEIPPKDLIHKVITAGWLAPYAALAVGPAKDFRRFYIVPQGSKAMARIKTLMQEEAENKLIALRRELEDKPFLEKKLAAFISRLELAKDKGIRGVGTAPYYVIIAEKKGFPPAEQQSLAHCLENMWLKATELELGFQLVSMTAELIHNREFCEILRLDGASYGVNGCAMGYPAQSLIEKRERIQRIVEELD